MYNGMAIASVLHNHHPPNQMEGVREGGGRGEGGVREGEMEGI